MERLSMNLSTCLCRKGECYCQHGLVVTGGEGKGGESKCLVSWNTVEERVKQIGGLTIQDTLAMFIPGNDASVTLLGSN